MRDGSPSPPLRLFYVSGPSDAVAIHDDLVADATRTYFGTNYMEKFLRLADSLGADTWIETWLPGTARRERRGQLTFNNAPEPNTGGMRYHLGQIALQMRLLRRMWRFRPDVVVLTGHQNYWWLYAPIRILRPKVIASIHGMFWTPFHPLRPHQALLRALNRRFGLPLLDVAVVTSDAIGEQIANVTRDLRRPRIIHHLPTWKREQFAGLAPLPRAPGEPLRVVYTGRIEPEKGVFDLLEVAAALARSHPGDFVFDLCGDGSALSALREEAGRRGLGSDFVTHGFCDQARMRAVIGRGHVLVVPTRAECTAGFEMVAAEAIMSGRPIVTSAVVPAIAYLRDAAIEVAPDSVAQYCEALVSLHDDAALLARLQVACAPLSEQFYDEANSWDVAMREALTIVGIAAPPVRAHVKRGA